MDQPCNRTGLRRRDFMRASAVSLAAVAATRSLEPARAQSLPVSGTVGPPYVGAGATAPVRPFALNDVKLGSGLLKEKQDRILAFARAYDERRFLVLFNTVAGRPNPPGVSVPGGWEDGGLLSGHWAGHFMTSLAQAGAGTGEPVFADKLAWMVDELGACQDALAGATVHPGYLGAKPEDVVLRLGPPRFAVYGANQDTNTWAPWYVQHKIVRGLLDAYSLTGNRARVRDRGEDGRLGPPRADARRREASGLRRPDHARRPQPNVGHLHRRRVRRRERGVRRDRRPDRRGQAPGDRQVLR